MGISSGVGQTGEIRTLLRACPKGCKAERVFLRLHLLMTANKRNREEYRFPVTLGGAELANDLR